MRLLAPITLLAPLALSGCASLSTPPQLLVETFTRGAPAPGAECVVSTGQGQWRLVTPGSVAVGRPAGDLRVDCSRDDLRDTTLIVSPIPFYYSPHYDPMFGSRASLYWGRGWHGGWRDRSRFGLGMNFPLSYQQPDRWEYPDRVRVEMGPR